MTVRTYGLLIDWSRDGTFSGTREDVSGYVLSDSDIVVTWGREAAQVNTQAVSGSMSFALRNDDQAFSPERTTSPIYGLVEEGTPVKFQMSGTSLLEGVLDGFTVDQDHPARAFTAEVRDAWGQPGAERLSTPVYRGIRTGEAVHLILDDVGWTGARDIDPGVTFMPFWWAEGQDAAGAISDLVASEGPPSIAYVEGGTFIFRDRQHRILRAQSLTSQATFAHAAPGGSRPTALKVSRGFGYNHGLRDITNVATFAVDTRGYGEVAVVWSTTDTISISDGETQRLVISGSEPFIQAIVPEQDIDYILSAGIVSISLSRDSGAGCIISITAVGGDAVVTGMALRANPVVTLRTQMISAEDSTSISRRGRRTWSQPAPWVNVYDADALATRIIGTFAEPRPSVTLSFSSINPTHTAQILARKISDRITVINDDLGLNQDFYIERIVHTVRGLLTHTVEFGCQVVGPTQPTNVFRFNTTGQGFNQGVFGAAGIDDPANIFQFDGASGHRFDQGVFAT